MKNLFYSGWLIFLCSVSLSNGWAQSFTQQQAIDFAVKNNLNIQNAEADAKIAIARKNETAGIGLPQISGNIDGKEFWEIPTSVIPDFISPLIGSALGLPPTGGPTYIYAKFGIRYNITAGLSASQLLFSSDYMIGLQAAKAYTDLAKKEIDRSRIETIAAVRKAYCQAMINVQNAKLIEINIERLKQLSEQTKALNQAGFVENTDLDRIELLYNNLLSEKDKVMKLMSLSQALLKFQMGYDLSKPIIVTDSIDVYNLPELQEVDPAKNASGARIEYLKLQDAVRLQELDLKRNRLSYLPNLVMYSSLSASNLQNKFSDIKFDNKWFPTGIIGITLNQSIFDGLQKNYRTQQASLGLLKLKNNLKQFEQAAAMEVQSAAVIYNNAILSVQNQQKNVALADKIYKASKLKYEQGAISNLDLFVSFSSLKEAQNNLYQAVFEFLSAKVDYEKATGIIK